MKLMELFSLLLYCTILLRTFFHTHTHTYTIRSVFRAASTPRSLYNTNVGKELLLLHCLHACMRAFSRLGGRRSSASCQNLEFIFLSFFGS